MKEDGGRVPAVKKDRRENLNHNLRENSAQEMLGDRRMVQARSSIVLGERVQVL